MTAPTISTEGLRELLERGAPVTVLDVRPPAERAEWRIPGSVHADAYDAPRRGDPNPLANLHPTSGGPARGLAVETGARLCLPTTARVSFQYAPLKDGDTLRVGSAGLRVFHTPGHTPESACYLLSERALFTGDTLFLAAVGRPDLEASAEQARSRAHVLHASLRRLLALPPETVVLPAHTSGPVAFDGRPISATLEEVQERTPLLRETEETFVSQILTRLPPTPPNHHRIVALNEAGTFPDDATELEAGAHRCAVA